MGVREEGRKVGGVSGKRERCEEGWRGEKGRELDVVAYLEFDLYLLPSLETRAPRF